MKDMKMKKKSLRHMKRDIKAISHMMLAVIIVVIAVAAGSIIYVVASQSNGNNNTSNDVTTTTLSISGSTTADPMVQLAANQYMTNNTNVQISVDSVGSGAGLSALEAGSVDMAMLSSTVSALGGNPTDFQETQFAYDGIIVFIGNATATYHGLTSNELVMDAAVALKMYEGDYTTWGALETAIGVTSTDTHSTDPLNVYYRSDSSGTQTDFAQLYMDDKGYFSTATWTTAEKNSTFKGANGNTGMISDVEGDHDGIGFTSFGLVSSDKNAQAFSYNPTSLASSGQVFASKATITEGVMKETGGYGCTRALEFATMGTPSAADEAFINYILTISVNEQLCNDTGFVSIYVA